MSWLFSAILNDYTEFKPKLSKYVAAYLTQFECSPSLLLTLLLLLSLFQYETGSNE